MVPDIDFCHMWSGMSLSTYGAMCLNTNKLVHAYQQAKTKTYPNFPRQSKKDTYDIIAVNKAEPPAINYKINYFLFKFTIWKL